MIAVSGMGIISALGIGVDETLDALLREKSGVGELKYLETANTDILCAEVSKSDDELRAMLNLSPKQTITRTALLGVIAAKEALTNAHLDDMSGKRVGFINGTTVGGMEKSEKHYLDFLEGDLHSEYIAEHECGACTEKIAKLTGKYSFVTTMSTACSSAANAIMMGANLIKAGIINTAVVGGSECITKFHLNGFKTLMILDSVLCRPFDATRTGLNLGEGAAFLVLERKEDAIERGAEVLCYLTGYGNACDAFHQTASSEDGRGATLSMQKALKMSGLKPEMIDYINAHGTGTTNNDASEGQAVVNIFGDNPPLISSTKSRTGHTTSAAGGVEAVISILAIRKNFVPANINFQNQMPELPFAPVRETIRNIEVKNVLSNSFGFGGNNSSLIFSK